MSTDALLNVFKDFADQISDFVSSGLVDAVEGVSIVSHTASDSSKDSQMAEAYMAEITKLHLRAQRALKDTSLTESLILQTSNGLLLTSPMPGTDFLWTVVVGARANVALTRSQMRRFREQVRAALP